MSWGLAYLFGLLSGAALAALIGVFLHAQSWSELAEAYDAMQATACDWRNRADAEFLRADKLRAEVATLTDDLAMCRRHNAEADEEIMGLTASLAEAVAVREVAAAVAAARLNCIDSMTDDADALRTECESLRSQLADAHKSLDAAMAHVEQLLVKRDAGIVERDSLLAQVRGLHEAVQAVTDERNDAAARADASNARCQQAVRDRAKAYDGMRAVVKLIESTQKECS